MLKSADPAIFPGELLQIQVNSEIGGNLVLQSNLFRRTAAHFADRLGYPKLAGV